MVFLYWITLGKIVLWPVVSRSETDVGVRQRPTDIEEESVYQTFFNGECGCPAKKCFSAKERYLQVVWKILLAPLHNLRTNKHNSAKCS